MKILVVSDSHGQSLDLVRLKERYEDEVVAMIHCGDSELERDHPALDGFMYVRGNCDWERSFPDHIVKEFGRFRFLITHGHLYNINMTLQNLSYKAEEVQANVALFGHSHKPGSEVGDDGVLYINPGSILLPRGRIEKTYCILELKEHQINVDFYEVTGNHMKSLSATYQMR